MTTKRELERLARKALGKGAKVRLNVRMLGPDTAMFNASGAYPYESGSVSVTTANDVRMGEKMLAAALRGIIAWKEGKE